jgi:hypothetical protein
MSPPKQQQPVREEAAMMERRKCVVDFLSFLETLASSFANSLGLPAFGILSASWSYGINIENAVIRFRNANPAFAYGLANMTIEEFVHFLLVPDAYPKYAAWSDRLLSMIETSALSPTMTAATMSAALAGASKCLSSYASKAARESAASLSKQLKSSPSSSSQKNSIDRNTKLVDALAGLSAAFGVKPGVDYFSKLSNKFLEKIDAKQQRGKATTTAAPESKDALSAFISSIRKKLSRAVASKNINGQAQIVASVAVVSDDDVAKPFIESLNRFVVVLDSMTLRKGSHPDVKVDASEALLKLSTLLEHVVKKASADKAAKKALVATVSAFADVFRKSKLVAGTSKEQREQLRDVALRNAAHGPHRDRHARHSLECRLRAVRPVRQVRSGEQEVPLHRPDGERPRVERGFGIALAGAAALAQGALAPHAVAEAVPVQPVHRRANVHVEGHLALEAPHVRGHQREVERSGVRVAQPLRDRLPPGVIHPPVLHDSRRADLRQPGRNGGGRSWQGRMGAEQEVH